MTDVIKLDIRKERLTKNAALNSVANEAYRDTIATVDGEGKRIWIYPKKPSGRYHNWRIAVTVVLLALLFGGPFITINDQPFLLLNFFERRFIILGQLFGHRISFCWPLC